MVIVFIGYTCYASNMCQKNGFTRIIKKYTGQ